MKLNHEQFLKGHEAFKEHMLEQSDGIPFTSFRHRFLMSDEIIYKWEVVDSARSALQLEQWPNRIERTGWIIERLKKACHSSVSNNLLEHRWGYGKSSEQALYHVESKEIKHQLEQRLLDLFTQHPCDRSTFGQNFDSLADFLRGENLSANWAFLAYLAFIACPEEYFPIRPTRFDALMSYYGIDQRISGHATWDRYLVLLDLADALRDRLMGYGEADAIEIQSYMWVVSYLITREEERLPMTDEPTYDFVMEMNRRRKQAARRERIGILGEEHVYQEERKRLLESENKDLADKVEMVSFKDPSAGFDILSFKSDGGERKIEVKSTGCDRAQDPGFWLTENERAIGLSNEDWCVFRVWNADQRPSCGNLGNLLLEANTEWNVNPASWFVSSNEIGMGNPNS